MLKKKIRELVRLEQSQEEKKFEVIHDAMAVQVVGGSNCEQLTSCGTYSGTNCTVLEQCSMFVQCSNNSRQA